MDYQTPRPQVEETVDPPWWKKWLEALVLHGIVEPILTIAIVLFLLWLTFR